jgi:hypothetical protein
MAIRYSLLILVLGYWGSNNNNLYIILGLILKYIILILDSDVYKYLKGLLI